MFTRYVGDLMGIAISPVNIVVKWSGGNIIFSFARRGDAIHAHFAADKKDLRMLRVAFAEFIDWIFSVYPWCVNILATIDRGSIERAIIRVGFEFMAEIATGQKIYKRGRKWVQ